MTVLEFPISRVPNHTMPPLEMTDTIDRLVGGVAALMKRPGGLCDLTDAAANAVLHFEKVFADTLHIAWRERDATTAEYTESFQCYVVFSGHRINGIFDDKEPAPLHVRLYLAKLLVIAEAFLASGKVRRTLC